MIRVTLLFIALICAGLVLSSGIKLGYLPPGTDRSILIQVEYRGAYAEEMERIVVGPLEKSLALLRGMTELFSVAEEGRCRVYIRFGPAARSLDRAYLNVREAVDAVYATLPRAVQRPLILKSDYRSFPVFITAFPRERTGAETALKRPFENLEGTGEIEIGGGIRREIQIVPDANRCAAFAVSVDEIISSLRRGNLLASFGREPKVPILLDGRLESIAQMEDLVVRDGIRLGDIAAVSWREVVRESIGRVDGEARTLVYVHPAGDANTVALCRDLRRVSRQLGGRVLYDSGRRIERALLEVLELVVLGIGLVALLTLLFLKAFYPALLVSLDIPFALLVTLAVLRVLGREINVMTLSGLAIGVGLVIDASIVFCEEFLAVGGDRSRALKNVGPALIFSSATTLAVFFPLLFAGEKAATKFGDLALTVSLCVSASLLYVFLFLPTYLSGTCDASRQKALGKDKSSSMLLRKTFLGLTRIRALPLMLLSLSLGGAAVLLPGLRAGGLLLQEGDRLALILEYPSGFSLNYVFASAGPLEASIAALDGVDHVAAKYQKERASFDITLGTGAETAKVRAEVKEMESRCPPAFFYFPETSQGLRTVEVILTGTENGRLRELAEDLSRKIAALPGTGQVVYHYKRAGPIQKVRVNLSDSARLGLDPYRAYACLYWMLSEPVAAKWTRGGEEADIRIVRGESFSAQAVMDMRIVTPAGEAVELKNIATLDREPGPGRISHYNRRRSVSFAVMTEGVTALELTQGIENIVKSSPLPFGYHAEIGKDIREQAQALRAGLRTLALAILVIFLILAFEFECLTLPLFILLQVPLAFVLPICLLRLFAYPVSLSVIAGLILTAGVAVNNCIVVLAPYGRRRLEALPVLAILERKMRAILIASLTTVLGVLPLFFSSGRGFLPPLSLVMAAGIGGSLPLFFLSLALFSRVRSGGDRRTPVSPGQEG
jgi:HAE1 family hydrophobic/amphiphilic exporter-1